MQKFGDSEKLQRLSEPEQEVVSQHLARTGKTKVSDLSETERESLMSELNSDE